MASKKTRVRDARFRDRTDSAPRLSPTPGRPQGAGGASSPRQPFPPPSPRGPSWLNANVVIPAVLAVGLLGVGVMYYRSQHPAVVPVTADDGGAAATADGALALALPTPGAPTPTPTPGAPAHATDAAVQAVPSAADAGIAPGQAPADGGAEVLNGDPVEASHPEPATPDPRHGHFTLSDATAGLAGTGSLVAEIETSMGVFTCDLASQEAPSTVANFVGLARGVREFWDPVAGQWAHRPFFDGSVFHRVIPDFMIQGGDFLRSGSGGTGYEFADENTHGHDAAGQLCMANHGPNTNGGQFFITEGAKPHLDGSYSIFGRCRPTDLVGQIARVPTHGSRPVTPVFIRHVRIRHGA